MKLYFGLERAQTIREAAYTEVIERISIIEAKLNSNVLQIASNRSTKQRLTTLIQLKTKKQLSALGKLLK